MPTLRSKNRSTCQRWMWMASCLSLLGIGIAAWSLIFRPPVETSTPMETSKLDPTVHIETDAATHAPPSNITGTDSVIENSTTPIPDAPLLKPLGTLPPTMDRAARERMESGGTFVPGAAEVAARNAELQPNEAELLEMTSSELVDELVTSPLQVALYHSSDNRFDAQLTAYERTNKGVGILLSRPDAASSLLATYRACSDSLVAPETPDDEPSTGLEFAALETFLGSTRVLEQFESEGQLPALIETVLQSIERQAQFDATQSEPVYGESMLTHSATVVGRALERLNDRLFIEWMTASEQLGILTERMPTYEEAREILDMAATAYAPGSIEMTSGSPDES